MTRRKVESKVEIPTAKDAWHPSLLIGQMVLVSSRSNQGEVHTAGKSWLTMISASPPMLALCCRLSHRTAINVLETREFVINIPGDDLISRVWMAGDSAAADLEAVDAPAWTYTAALKVSAPRIQECRGHIECTLDSIKRLNEDELIFFARIAAVSIDESLLKGAVEERYRALRQILYLEDGFFSVVDGVRKIPT